MANDHPAASSRKLSLQVDSRPVCKIQAKRGASSSVVAESVKAPEWWHSTRIIQAFDSVLQDKVKNFCSYRQGSKENDALYRSTRNHRS